MRKKKLWAKLMSAALSAAMILGLMPVSALAVTVDANAADGTYTGSATVEPDEEEDFDAYDIDVNVVIEDGAITSVVFASEIDDEDNETYSNKAMNGTKTKTGVAAQIIEANGTDDVDVVAGATCTSKAIIEAVNVALAGDPVTAVDKTDLNETIESVALLSESDYTEDSWETLQMALGAAESVAVDEDATQTEVDEATTALTEAIENLETADALDTTDLAEAISDAEELTESDYTSESWAVLATALSEGETVLADENATQDEVDAAAAAITSAIAALVSASSDTDPVYVVMNIPYSDFFNAVAPTAEQAEEHASVDTVSYATSKYGISDDGEGDRNTAGTSKGTYDDGTSVKGVYYAVKMDADTYEELKDAELTEGDDYYFDEASEEEPSSYLTLTYSDGVYSFSSEGLAYAGGEAAELDALTYTSSYGDYMFELLNVENNGTYSDGSGKGLSIDGEEVTIAVEYLTFSDGSMIALYNVDNIWMGTRYNHQIAWSVVNGKGLYKGHNNSSNPLCYQYDMSDYTLVSVSVVTDLGVYTYECEQELLPYYSGTDEVTVEAQDGSDEVTVTVPNEFEDVTVSVYYSTGSGRNVTTVYVANAASLSADGVITLDEVIDCDTNGTYTILVESSNYAPVTVTLDPLMSESQIETLTELAEIGEAVGTDDNTTLSEHVAEAKEMLASADSTYYSEAAELIEELEGYVLSAVKTYAENIVASVDGYAESDYTVASWSDLQEKLAAANEALEDGSSYTDIYETAVSLSEAIAALTAAGDTISLTEAIGEANDLEETDYTVASWEVLQDAIAAAEEAIAARAEQDALDELQAAIEAAVTALVAAGDTTEIEEAIEEAKAKNETDYTAASWEALQEAIVAAEEAVAARADDDELAAAVAALTAAMEALEAVDVTELESAITSAEALTESDYTSDSWAALQSALTAAKEALEAREGQEAIDAAAANLQAAISALVKAPTDDTDTDALTDTTSDSSSSSSSTTSTDSSSTSTSSSSTATGDSTDLWIWVMLAMAAVAAGGAAVKRRKNF